MLDTSQESTRGLTREQIRAVVKADGPVVLGYAIVGVPFGMIGASLGFEPLQVFMLSFFFLSGAGQAMMQNMLMAGFSIPATVASVTLVSSRHILYSSAMAPYARGISRLKRFLLAWNLTDEGFGVNLDRLESKEPWSINQAIAVNTVNQITWGLSTLAGALAVSVVALPTALANFGITCIFICLMATQKRGLDMTCAICSAFLGVFLAKAAGLASVAVMAGAVLGVIVGYVAGGRLREKREGEGSKGGARACDESPRGAREREEGSGDGVE